MAVKLKIEKISDAMQFINAASKLKGNVWLSNETGCRVNGKSVLGVFDIAMKGDVFVEYTDTSEEFDALINKLGEQTDEN